MKPYEMGQCFIEAADALGDKEQELRDGGYNAEADFMLELRLLVGDRFNKMRTHPFSMACHREEEVAEEMDMDVVVSIDKVPTRDELVSTLTLHREEIREADEWRPLAEHVRGIIRGCIMGYMLKHMEKR